MGALVWNNAPMKLQGPEPTKKPAPETLNLTPKRKSHGLVAGPAYKHRRQHVPWLPVRRVA